MDAVAVRPLRCWRSRLGVGCSAPRTGTPGTLRGDVFWKRRKSARTHWSLVRRSRATPTARDRPTGMFRWYRDEPASAQQWTYVGDSLSPLTYDTNAPAQGRKIGITFDWMTTLLATSPKGCGSCRCGAAPWTSSATCCCIRDLIRGERRFEYTIRTVAATAPQLRIDSIGEERIETERTSSTVPVPAQAGNGRRRRLLVVHGRWGSCR